MILPRVSRCFLLALCSLSFILPGPWSLGAPEETIRSILSSWDDSSKQAQLSEIAAQSYAALLSVPERGLKASEDDLRAIIQVRKKIEKMPETEAKVLALRLQQAVDLVLISELCRNEFARREPQSHPGYDPSGFGETEFGRLVGENRLSVQPYFRHLKGKDGMMKELAGQSEVDAEGVKGGQVVRNAAIEKRQKLSALLRAARNQDFSQDRDDLLFAELLASVDDARDTRVVSAIYMRDHRLPDDNASLRAEIDKQLKESPWLRVSDGRRGSSLSTVSILQKYVGSTPEHYVLALTQRLLPFLKDSEQIPSEVKAAFPSAMQGAWLARQ